MRKIMEYLLTLQKLKFDDRARTTASQPEAEKLCAQVPTPILANYERLVARGKKGVALARSGVCSECHLRITSGKLANLSSLNEIHLCDDSGRCLYLPGEESVEMADTPTSRPSAVQRTAKDAARHVA